PALPVKIALPAAALPPELRPVVVPPLELGGGELEVGGVVLAVVIGREPRPTELALLVVVPAATMTITITATPTAVPIKAATRTFSMAGALYPLATDGEAGSSGALVSPKKGMPGLPSNVEIGPQNA